MEEESSKEAPTTSCGSTTIGVRLMTCVGILERVGRPSRPAPRRPTTAVWLTQPPGAFGGCAARRPSSGRRLVSSCDGPMPASPASIFLSISVPSTLRRHVSYTWRGRWQGWKRDSHSLTKQTLVKLVSRQTVIMMELSIGRIDAQPMMISTGSSCIDVRTGFLSVPPGHQGQPVFAQHVFHRIFRITDLRANFSRSVAPPHRLSPVLQ